MEQGGDLTRRIAATLSLVFAIDLLFLVVVASLFRPWLAPVQRSVAAITGYDLPVWPAVVVPGLAACLWFQVRYARRETLAEAGAREVSADEYPDLHARVARLATQASLPKPSVAVADTDVPNSFVVGGQRDSVIVVSQGLLDALGGDELDAVLAHELAHVKNRDSLVMTLAGFLPALASDEYSLWRDTVGSGRVVGWILLSVPLYFLAAVAIDAPLFTLRYTGVFVGLVAFTALFGSAILGLLAAPVLVLARDLSRSREFAADRAGALVCGDPAALASALRTLDGATDAPARDRRTLTGGGLRGLCLLPHGFERGDGEEGEGVAIRWRSHPPLEDRLDRLGDLVAEMESQ